MDHPVPDHADARPVQGGFEQARHRDRLGQELAGGGVEDRRPLAGKRSVKHPVNATGHSRPAGASGWSLGRRPWI